MPSSENKHPKIFLFLSALMVLIAVLTFVFEEELFEVYYQDITFLVVLTGSITAALFFLYAYRFPRIGLPLLGRSIELDERTPPKKSVGIEYGNLSPSATDHKRAMTRAKSARRLRKQAVRATREMNEQNNKIETDE